MFSVKKNIMNCSHKISYYHFWLTEPENIYFLNYAISDCGQNVYMTLSGEDIYNLHQWFKVRNFFIEPKWKIHQQLVFEHLCQILYFLSSKNLYFPRED